MLTINGGSYQSIRKSGGDGVWNGNQYASLTITDGTFTGSSRSGLFIDKNVGSGIIKISGGTFKSNGNANGISGNSNISYSSILNGASATGYYNGGSESISSKGINDEHSSGGWFPSYSNYTTVEIK